MSLTFPRHAARSYREPPVPGRANGRVFGGQRGAASSAPTLCRSVGVKNRQKCLTHGANIMHSMHKILSASLGASGYAGRTCARLRCARAAGAGVGRGRGTAGRVCADRESDDSVRRDRGCAIGQCGARLQRVARRCIGAIGWRARKPQAPEWSTSRRICGQGRVRSAMSHHRAGLRRLRARAAYGLTSSRARKCGVPTSSPIQAAMPPRCCSRCCRCCSGGLICAGRNGRNQRSQRRHGRAAIARGAICCSRRSPRISARTPMATTHGISQRCARSARDSARTSI